MYDPYRVSYEQQIFIALINDDGKTLVKAGHIHCFAGDFYLVRTEDDSITYWYPASMFYHHVGYDVYGKRVFSHDVVGFFTPDGKRKVGIVFEDENDEAIIREVTMVAEALNSETHDYDVLLEHDDGEDYYLTTNGVRRLCSTLKPDFREIEEFISGRSIETDQMEPTRKIEYEESQG